MSTNEIVRSNGKDEELDTVAAETEIVRTRAAIDGTIVALHGRLNPTVLKEQVLESFGELQTTLKAELKDHLQQAKEFANAELQTIKADAVAQIAKTGADLKQALIGEIAHVKAELREATVGRIETAAIETRARLRATRQSAVALMKAHPVRTGIVGSLVASVLGFAWFLVRRSRRRALPAARRAHRS